MADKYKIKTVFTDDEILGGIAALQEAIQILTDQITEATDLINQRTEQIAELTAEAVRRGLA